MVTMDMSLAQLVRSHKITLDMALERCSNEDDLRRLLNG
jgi:Tfp pilus assembly pilus retraction ATPase PilT